MTLPWKWRRSNRAGGSKVEASKGIAIDQEIELTIPIHFRCPISLDLMKDPVTLLTGITYDRHSIEKWFDAGHATCPVTNQALFTFDQIPNHFIRKMIQDWCVEHESCGVERIPIAPNEVSAVCSRMEAASRHGDAHKCGELLGKIDTLAKESERNKRCIVKNGIANALANMFESFARFYTDSNISLLRGILSALTWTFPLDQEANLKLKSNVSLRVIAQLLKCEDDLSSRQNAILVLKEVITMDRGCLEGLMGIEEIEETLFRIVKFPISPKATKATLVIIHHIISSSAKQTVTSTMKFVQMGLVPLILDILVDCNKSLCEKALCIIDTICNSKEGRESAYSNALTLPLLVKNLLRVSNVSTEITVSTLRKLCFGENKNALIETVQFGAFQKLLVILQIEISEETKDKVTELLKLINLHRHKSDCFQSSLGLRYLKRSDDM